MNLIFFIGAIAFVLAILYAMSAPKSEDDAVIIPLNTASPIDRASAILAGMQRRHDESIAPPVQTPEDARGAALAADMVAHQHGLDGRDYNVIITSNNGGKV